MRPYRWIIVGSWLLFVGYWAAAAVGVKREAGTRRWRQEILLRLTSILLITALLWSRSLRELLAGAQRRIGDTGLAGWAGVVLCLLGFGLAIDARRHLGRN